MDLMILYTAAGRDIIASAIFQLKLKLPDHKLAS
jgi:hypothetical protein